MKILCAGFLMRYPIGGMSWHHMQYLIGLRRLGHEVIYFENFGWPNSCYDPVKGEWTPDATRGIRYFLDFLDSVGESLEWCYLSETGTTYGLSRSKLAAVCRDCDLYLDLSYMNWIPELEDCRCRALVDTDPVFTQIGGHGAGGQFADYHVLFTYGENIHHPGCTMPDAGLKWIPTRQPVVLDLWPIAPGNPKAPFTTVMNWSAYGQRTFEGKIYGQKDLQFSPYFEFPNETRSSMELAISAPDHVRLRLQCGGWNLADPVAVSATPISYQAYLKASKAEFSVAKHAYVCTQSGWFSDRTAAYLACGRPALIEDTGFSRWLPCGNGVVPFRTPEEAVAGLENIGAHYEEHCRNAREIAGQYFDSRDVLERLVEAALHPHNVRATC
jgi:hypothetical protein